MAKKTGRPPKAAPPIQTHELQLSYPAVLITIGAHVMKEATESRAFLSWFLESYYRLEDTALADCICDGDNDKGIDGIYVNDQLNQIDVFQSRLKLTEKTIGDSGVRDFVGTLSQLRSESAVNHLQQTTQNKDLAARLKDQDIAKKVRDGFEVRGIFVTNARADKNATDFLVSHPQVTLYDRLELQKSHISIAKTGPMKDEVTFDVSGLPYFKYPIGPDLQMVMAPIPATELLKMQGISNGDLFAWNVRQWLKNTTVNKAIAKSLKSPSEHRYFPAFHNGMTVLCEKLSAENDKITIAGYSVVNGCQSLNAISENRAVTLH